MKKSRKTTIYEVARQSEVSIATVSRVMNPETRGFVALQTRKKIESVIHRLRYTPSLAARHLSRSAYRTVGVVLPHHKGMLLSSYYSEILSGVSDALLEFDYRFKLILLKPGSQNWDTYDFQNGEGVDGLILTYWHSIFSSPEIFQKFRFPCVILNNVEQHIDARFVAGDHEEGGRLAAQYLYERGHRRILIVGGKEGAPDAQARLRGFEKFLSSKDVAIGTKDFVDVNFEENKAYAVAEEILKTHPKTTAIFCMNDTQAHGLLRRLQELGVNCPQQISVMGYDDDQFSSYSLPPLTSIKIPTYEMARAAALDIIKSMENRKFRKKEFCKIRLFAPQIIERSSVRNV